MPIGEVRYPQLSPDKTVRESRALALEVVPSLAAAGTSESSFVPEGFQRIDLDYAAGGNVAGYKRYSQQQG
jgi:hypothetical protein